MPCSRFAFASTLLPLLAASLGGCFIEDRFVDPLDHDDEPESAEEREGPAIILRISTDPEGPRLSNFGLPASMPEGHAGQDPQMHFIGAHHAELAPTAFTLPGAGLTVLDSPHTREGGERAVDFDEEPVVAPGGEIVAATIADLAPGTYEYLRLSVSYQEYDVDFQVDVGGQAVELSGRLASFVEGNTFIRELELDGDTLPIDANRSQGWWAFKAPYAGIVTGQAPVGATTVPNPIDATSPVEIGSCIVTAAFDEPLVIRGDETEDIVISVTLSTNQSFEWIDTNDDGAWQPLAGEVVVDMGVRGMALAVD